MKKILLVDDEKLMLDLLELYLVPAGYSCIKSLSGKNAVDHVLKEEPALIILDLMMPEMNGFEVCKEIRSFSDVPIIMVTARDQQEDIVKGLQTGADDYITKPFNEMELLARIEAILRRTRNNLAVEYKGLKWNERSQEASYNGEPIFFTPKEFQLAGIFLKNRNKVFNREHLIHSIWGYDADTEDRTVDSHVRHLREKLRKTGFPIDDHLQTVWGAGYKWKDEKNK
ncbi:response regulator transcription factor [Metabacillus idriensis]|uniref:response regulator transcription factor n=1 Tax=Metabacillus idriensis TaxID=324768 RepID=UPI002813D11F|nr:response regulator transcription factor [Metabacillus idriensis]MDR0139853.1 response regulator transcription factor [Metabacillus idriensis]